MSFSYSGRHQCLAAGDLVGFIMQFRKSVKESSKTPLPITLELVAHDGHEHLLRHLAVCLWDIQLAPSLLAQLVLLQQGGPNLL